MTKLPVFKAIGATFAYFIGEFWTVLRIVWLPLVLMGAGLAFAGPRYAQAMLAIAELGPEPDPAELLPLAGPMFAAMGVMLLIFAVGYPMIFAGVMRHVIRGEAPGLPFYLNFGADEIRVLATYVIVAIMAGLAYFVGVVAVAVVSALLSVIASATGVGALAGFFIAVCLIAFAGAFLWFLIRLSLALPAAIGARTIGVAQSWVLTKGNAGRLFVYWAFWVMLFAAVECAAILIIAPGYFSDLAAMAAASSDPEAARQLQLEMMRRQLSLTDVSAPRAILIAVSGFAFAVIFFGLWASSLGVAYRYVAGGASVRS